MSVVGWNTVTSSCIIAPEGVTIVQSCQLHDRHQYWRFSLYISQDSACRCVSKSGRNWASWQAMMCWVKKFNYYAFIMYLQYQSINWSIDACMHACALGQQRHGRTGTLQCKPCRRAQSLIVLLSTAWLLERGCGGKDRKGLENLEFAHKTDYNPVHLSCNSTCACHTRWQ